MSKLVEKKISSQTVYKGNFLDVKKDNVVLPNGKNSTREWINHPGAVVIVPILSNGKIALIRQFRYAMGSEFIELPAGKIDKRETPDECAIRELEEEIGFKTKNTRPPVKIRINEVTVSTITAKAKYETIWNSDTGIRVNSINV